MRRWTLPIMGCVVAAVFVWGVVDLLSLRLESGESHAPFSTYRTGPLGAKACFESLDVLEGVTAERHLESYEKLEGGAGDTVFYVGMAWYGDINEIELPLVEKWQAIAERGGRVVLAFRPAKSGPAEGAFVSPGDAASAAEDSPGEDPGADTPAEDASPDESADEEPPELADYLKVETVMLPEHWGLRCAFDPLTPRNAAFADKWGGYWAERSADLPGLPAELPIGTALFFTDLDPAWRVVYGTREKAAVVERSFGGGTVVLFADSMPFSNQALAQSQRLGMAPLLSWAAGPVRRAVFDEYLKGVRKKKNIMTLARSYRLHGLGLGLLAVFILWAWRQMTPLVPPQSSEDTAGLEGQSSTAALAHLLRRSVVPEDLPRVCAQEWARHAPVPRSHREKTAPELERIALGARDCGVVESYRRMRERAARKWKG